MKKLLITIAILLSIFVLFLIFFGDKLNVNVSTEKYENSKTYKQFIDTD
ncbi:hypothetical protein GV828_03905 [Flavobacterium sp. NST-5]|uniref:Uncharacterized protein n=1 Tax=Flavobacterium ichthyis TaxID=2698827 RepID=A0ABW9Z689_9FLAO|nr:hypothetical protein [Flavobacterium ichthyis]NBL64345.1 hypothetical protein [Flavobacterium ichthyis]